MNPDPFTFLKDLIHTPSPSGSEQRIQHVVRQFVQPFADEVKTDTHGNVYAIRHAAGPRIMLAGHCDQIALMVEFIDSEGYLFVQPMGGWDVQILLGQYLVVWGVNGPVNGVVARKAIHLLSNEERTRVPGMSDLWIDIGAKSREDAERLVAVGDCATFQLKYQELANRHAAATAMDDKVGVWVCMEALRLLQGRPLAASVHAVSTVAEEIGLRGATTATYTVEPAIGIAVDVCHATDTPGSDKKQVGDVKCGAGPVVFKGPNIHPRVFDLLQQTALQNSIPIQVRGVPKATGTDANAMQLSRGGVATALIGIPNRYMHSPVEVIHLDDLNNAARLLAEFCLVVNSQTNLIP